jgi:plastocyanin
MRQHIIALCGFVFLAVCGTVTLGSNAAQAVGLPDSYVASVSLPLPLAHGAQGHDTGGGDAPEGGWQHFVSWVGHFHPALTVFPIAMILSAALAELFRLWRKAPWFGGASRFCMIVGGITAAITAPLGWAFAVEHGNTWILQVHRWLGTAAGVGAVVLLVLSELAWRRGGRTMTLFRTILFLAIPLVIATGFFGGAMVYGIHEYDWNRPAHQHDQGSETSQSPAGPGIAPSSNSAVTEITMTDDDAFKPDQVTIAAGTTIQWKNTSKDAHTVTDDPHVASNARDVSAPAGAKRFNSGKIKPGGTFEQKFTIPGTYWYVCEPHEDMDMKGKVTVTASGAPAPTRPAH